MASGVTPNPLRHLPSVDALLSQADDLIVAYGRPLTVEAVRDAIAHARQRIRQSDAPPPDETILLDQARQSLDDWLAPTLRPVINATGVVIHTNLGRAPLSDAAISAMQGVAEGYSTLEFDLESGKRGSRSHHAADLVKRLTGAEAAHVVNNNAAATMLALSALAGGGEVIISRGQLVEIGGGYRMPDVMAASGAQMREVGTTNRTHLYDYERAITEETAAIMRAHHSNYKVVGFTTEPSIAEIADLARGRDVMAIDDLGSGALLDTSQFGLAPEPTIQESLAAGVDLILVSGDKLLGGPQAGILIGTAQAIRRVKRHPLARAVRADKLCLAALSATLLHYLKDEALATIPVWQMISAPQAVIRERAQAWADTLGGCDVFDGMSTVGGGSVPGSQLPTALLSPRVDSPERAAARLRAADPPVIARIEGGRLLLDPRTVLPRQEDLLLRHLRQLLAE